MLPESWCCHEPQKTSDIAVQLHRRSVHGLLTCCRSAGVSTVETQPKEAVQQRTVPSACTSGASHLHMQLTHLSQANVSVVRLDLAMCFEAGWQLLGSQARAQIQYTAVHRLHAELVQLARIRPSVVA